MVPQKYLRVTTALGQRCSWVVLLEMLLEGLLEVLLEGGTPCQRARASKGAVACGARLLQREHLRGVGSLWKYYSALGDIFEEL